MSYYGCSSLPIYYGSRSTRRVCLQQSANSFDSSTSLTRPPFPTPLAFTNRPVNAPESIPVFVAFVHWPDGSSAVHVPAKRHNGQSVLPERFVPTGRMRCVLSGTPCSCGWKWVSSRFCDIELMPRSILGRLAIGSRVFWERSRPVSEILHGNLFGSCCDDLPSRLSCMFWRYH